MRIFGLLGYPLSHSWSPVYFQQKFLSEGIMDAAYRLFETPQKESIPAILHQPDIWGLNVTRPYKESILSYLTEIEDTALAIGAVNTVTLKRSLKGVVSKGFNTDILGFKTSLLQGILPHHDKALVFGYGGAARAVCFVLKMLGIDYLIVSRNKHLTGSVGYESLSASVIKEYKLIINTTPLGQDGNPGSPLSPELCFFLSPEHYIFDLVYNPEITSLMAAGLTSGALVTGGLEMLHLQAEASWALWNE